jgi:enoyl-CoA hydratase
MPDEPLGVSQDGSVAVVTLNRPKVHNALNRRVLEMLAEVMTALDRSPEVRAIILTGAGDRAFCAGADLDELSGLDVTQAHDVLQFGQSVMAAVARSSVPVIAAVNGLALGGGFELVLASAFAVVSTKASFGLPESGLGLIPGYGGTQRLPRLVGPAVAAHLMLSGARLSAERAYSLGITPLQPTEPGELLAEAARVAASVAGRGPRANSAILEALRTRAPGPEDLGIETSLAAAATAGPEAAEGIAAFKERRQPNFPPRA